MKPCEYITLEIARERERQIDKEGYDPSHDDEHVTGELAYAAACYASPEPLYLNQGYSTCLSGHIGSHSIADAWPWDGEYDKRLHHDRRKQLVIAGALILAEIERLDRKSQREHQEGGGGKG